MSGFCSANFTASGLPTLGEVGSGEFGANSQSGLTKESFHRAIRWFGPFFFRFTIWQECWSYPRRAVETKTSCGAKRGQPALGTGEYECFGNTGRNVPLGNMLKRGRLWGMRLLAEHYSHFFVSLGWSHSQVRTPGSSRIAAQRQGDMTSLLAVWTMSIGLGGPARSLWMKGGQWRRPSQRPGLVPRTFDFRFCI